MYVKVSRLYNKHDSSRDLLFFAGTEIGWDRKKPTKPNPKAQEKEKTHSFLSLFLFKRLHCLSQSFNAKQLLWRWESEITHTQRYTSSIVKSFLYTEASKRKRETDTKVIISSSPLLFSLWCDFSFSSGFCGGGCLYNNLYIYININK